MINNNYIALLGASNFFCVSKPLVKILGFQTAGLLQEIISKYEWHNSKDADFDGLYYSQEKIANDFNISTKTVQREVNKLVNLNLITIKKKGLPCSLYYFVNADEIMSLISSIPDKQVTSDCPDKTRQNVQTGLDKKSIPYTIEERKEKRVEEEQQQQRPNFVNSEKKDLEVSSMRQQIIDKIKSQSPELAKHPSIRGIVDAIESKPAEQQLTYLSFVLQNKDLKQQCNVKGWQDWYWADFYTNQLIGDKDKKFVEFTEKELDVCKRYNLNPYGVGTWDDQFKTDSKPL